MMAHTTMATTIKRFDVSTFTRQAKNNWTRVAIIAWVGHKKKNIYNHKAVSPSLPGLKERTLDLAITFTKYRMHTRIPVANTAKQHFVISTPKGNLKGCLLTPRR